MIDSFSYWKTRYAQGQDSGNLLAKYPKFKSGFINDLVQTHGLKSCLDFGFGDCKVARLIDIDLYIGLDIAGDELARWKDGDWAAKNKELHTSRFDEYVDDRRFDLTTCLDVLYHILPHEELYLRYTLQQLVKFSTRFIFIVAMDSKAEMKPWTGGHVWACPWRQILEDEMGISLTHHIPKAEGGNSDAFLYEK